MKKIIKIKVYQSQQRINRSVCSSPFIADYLYCVYFFNILIHAVNLTAIDVELANQIFNNKIIYEQNT